MRYHVRIARPARDLSLTAAMYRDGLGLAELGRFEAHAGFDGVMLGTPGGACHMELTRRRGHAHTAAPSVDDLLVFYVPDQQEWRETCERMLRAGFLPTASANPYWDRCGRTFADPDGYRVVIQNASWPA